MRIRRGRENMTKKNKKEECGSVTKIEADRGKGHRIVEDGRIERG